MYLHKRNDLYMNIYHGFIHNYSNLETIHIDLTMNEINKMWYNHAYSETKENYWYKQQYMFIVVNKRSQIQKATYCMIAFI